jgi:hypothetical protein
VPDPDQHLVIEEIIELRHAGATFDDIADTLNRRGVPPPSGRAWYAMTVLRIYQRERAGTR